MATSFPDRVLLAAMRNRQLEGVALTALRHAVHLLGLAIGTRIGELRDHDDRLLVTASRLEEQALLLRMHTELRDVVAERWDKVPVRRRPHYTPEQRYRILRVRQLLALSRAEIATMVRVDEATIANWESEREREPTRTAIGAKVRPDPPVRRFADVVRGVVQAMGVAGFGGDEMIARTLARAGWKLSKRTVGRIRREKPVVAPTPPPEPERTTRTVTARRPNHVRMMDITEVPALFRIVKFRLIAVVDVFSRMPLAAAVTDEEPTAAAVVGVVEAANAAHGPAAHMITDQGSQFTAEAFRAACRKTRTEQRYGAIGKTGSIAIVERMWRTLKQLGRWRTRPPLTIDDFRERAELTLRHYAYCRPHAALGGATPAEIFFGITPAHLSAQPGPRGRPREGPTTAPFAIAYLEPEGRLPFLFPRAA